MPEEESKLNGTSLEPMERIAEINRRTQREA
jgi:hypothetical protein